MDSSIRSLLVAALKLVGKLCFKMNVDKKEKYVNLKSTLKLVQNGFYD